MLKVSQLIKFISDLNPQNTPTRLCFFNFLRGFAEPDEALSTELMDAFFDYTLDYPHWAANKNQLGREVQFLLENFNGFYQQKFDLGQIRFPQNRQILELEHFSDAMDAASCYVGSICNADDKFRLINDGNKRIVAIILRADRSIEVRTFDKKFTLRGGILEPLRRDLTLHYTANLELSSNHLQILEVAPYITARFRIQNEKVHGVLIRGYVFQKLLELKGENLKDQARLLFPIKRLEQFFVDRRTDPYYQELLSQLERTRALIQQGDREALQWGSMILSQAETALEHVFAGDKMLELLVRDLRHTAEASKDEHVVKITPLSSVGHGSATSLQARVEQQRSLLIGNDPMDLEELI